MVKKAKSTEIKSRSQNKKDKKMLACIFLKKKEKKKKADTWDQHYNENCLKIVRFAAYWHWPFYESPIAEVEKYFLNKLKTFFSFLFFLLSYWDTCLFFNMILQQVNWKPPLHSDWFRYVLVTLKLFSCQLKNCVCRLQNEIHSWNVPVTHWSGVSQRDYPWKQKEHRSVQRYCSVP